MAKKCYYNSLGNIKYMGDVIYGCDVFQGFLRPCHQVHSVQQVFVEPLSTDDWEILVSRRQQEIYSYLF